jgi:hypothetical protein
MEVDLYEVTAAQHNTSLREKKKEATSLAQQAYNDKRAKRYHVQLVNTNFKQGDYSWTGTYDDDHLPGADAKEQADRDWANFIKRVYRWCDKNGVERPKWVMATEYSTRGDDGKVTGRHHHHAIIQRTKGLDRDILEELWCDRKGEPLGLCRCEYLTMEHGSAASLVQYISKNKRCDRHWRQSRGLEKPKTPKPNDTKWSKRKLHEASTVHIDDAEYWERLYPGFKFDRAETNISDFGQRHTLVIMYRDSGFKRKQRYRERSRNGDDNLHCGQDRGRCEVS